MPPKKKTFNPIIKNWKHNKQDNNICGEVFGHSEFNNGTEITTNRLVKRTDIRDESIVETISGSKYLLQGKAPGDEL